MRLKDDPEYTLEMLFLKAETNPVEAIMQAFLLGRLEERKNPMQNSTDYSVKKVEDTKCSKK